VKAVAARGDVTATKGTIGKASYPAGGAWAAGDVAFDVDSKLVISGAAVLHEASCTFTHSGGQTTSTPPVTEASWTADVTLGPSSTKLKVGGRAVVLDGDTKQDAYGNTLKAGSSRKLKAG
jgi:hypothetical protein